MVNDKRNNILLNKKGQIVVEVVLLSVVVASLAILIAREIKRQEILSNLITGPWEILAGVVESGVPRRPADARTLHPNGRGISLRGD